jgi:hypothetical protein
MGTPAERFHAGAPPSAPSNSAASQRDRSGEDWVSRRVTTSGVVCVSWQQVSVGRHRAGSRCDVHADGDLLRFRIGNELVKTAARTTAAR